LKNMNETRNNGKENTKVKSGNSKMKHLKKITENLNKNKRKLMIKLWFLR